MNNKNTRIILEDKQNQFLYKKKVSNLDISFNRIAFVFFIPAGFWIYIVLWVVLKKSF